jgi:HSP90 family molecular chaperone
MLEDVAENQKDTYAEFWKQFGTVLKEGIGEDFANKERLAKLFRFASTHADEGVSLTDYVSRMKEGQDEIYVITADSLQVSPHLAHLLDHLRTNGLIRSLPCDEQSLRTYSSEEVRARICSGDPSWKELVSPEVAAHIESNGYFGGRCSV